MNPYVPGEQPGTEAKIIKLNTNENPYLPSANIAEVVDEILKQGHLRKYPQPTAYSLRQEIARREQIKPEQVLVTNGSDEGLALLFRATLGPKSKLVIPFPTYSLYPVLAESMMNQVEIEKIPVLQNLHFDFPALKQSRGNLLAFAHPNAPTGILEERSKLLQLIAAFPGIVLSDEAYIDFCQSKASLAGEIKNHANLIVSRTFSKSYSLAGLRLGYLLGSEQNIALLYKLKDSYNIGMLEQAIGLAALKDESYFQENIARIIASRQELSEQLTALGFTVIPSQANFLFTRPPAGIQPFELFQQLKQAGIFIRYFQDEVSRQYVRISIGSQSENEELLAKIRGLL